MDQTLEKIVATGKAVEGTIRDYCQAELSSQEHLLAIIQQSLPDIGLRLRPFLLRASYEAGGDSFSSVVPIAAGIELIQLSTLIIDDVLDESPLRNNRPSVCSLHGAKQAFSAGTVMSSFGFSIIAEALDQLTGLKNKNAVIGLLAQTHADIYIGQYTDLNFERDITISENQYLEMISKTTASFIQAPLVIGAMLWDAAPNILAVLEQAGYSLGMAYQLRDDVLDIIGDSECTGKPVAGDIRQRKMRLPVIHALQWSSQQKNTRLSELLQLKRTLHDSELRDTLHILHCAGSIEYSINKIRNYCKQAGDSLRMLSNEFESLGSHLHVIAGMISSFKDATELEEKIWDSLYCVSEKKN